MKILSRMACVIFALFATAAGAASTINDSYTDQYIGPRTYAFWGTIDGDQYTYFCTPEYPDCGKYEDGTGLDFGVTSFSQPFFVHIYMDLSPGQEWYDSLGSPHGGPFWQFDGTLAPNGTPLINIGFYNPGCSDFSPSPGCSIRYANTINFHFSAVPEPALGSA